MSRHTDPKSPRVGADVVEHIKSLLPENDEIGRLLEQERLRVRMTDGLRSVRAHRGMSQGDVAKRLGITQGRVSRLESADFDRRLDSVASYLHAVDASLVLAFVADGQLIPVMAPSNVRIEISDPVDTANDVNGVDITLSGDQDLDPTSEASYEFDYAKAA